MAIKDSQTMTQNAPAASSTSVNNEDIPTSSVVPVISEQSKPTLDPALDSATSSVATKAMTSTNENSPAEQSTNVKASAEPSESDPDCSGKQSNKTPADEDEGQNENTSARTWGPSAPLYCRINGQSHATLNDFGVWICPACHEDLRKPPPMPPMPPAPVPEAKTAPETKEIPEKKARRRHKPRPPPPFLGYRPPPPGLPPPPPGYRPPVPAFPPPPLAIPPGYPVPSYPPYGYPPQPYMGAPGRASSVDSDSQDGSESGDEAESGQKQPSDQVNYSIEYRDSGNYYLTREAWEGPFDLVSAREGLLPADRSVFEVTTILETSITASQHRSEYELRNIMNRGILTNPNVSVKVRTTRVKIHSIELIKIIRGVVNYYPANLQADTIELKAPYMLIAHHLEELETYLESHSDSSTLESVQPPHVVSGNDDHSASEKKPTENAGAVHLGMLLDFYKGAHYKALMEEKARHARQSCTFNMLWLLFRPGITVYFESDGQLHAYVVNFFDTSPEIFSTTGIKQRKEYTVSMWSLGFNGSFVGRIARTAYLPHFDGERQINSLKLFPCEFIDREDGGKTRTRLEENGKKWYDLLRGGQVHYSGRLLGGSKKQFSGRAYVDMSSYYAQDPNLEPDICDISDMGDELAKCQCEECLGLRPHPPTGFRWAHYDLLDPHVEKDLEIPGAADGPRHRYLLCGRLLHGFDLKSRTWVRLDVAYCNPPRMNSRAIDTLVMPTDRKEMIKALINKFTDSDSPTGPAGSWRADFLENKGEGQIFLLHGSPGVGKTYTAECIAEYTGRPMLSLTCADIGTDEVKMEKQLVKWFQLAEKWGAVMLIDEADVFLEKRQVTDLKRNSLVSVFLRCIEYYRGVLFLTTNRVGHFDDAFMSRIHVIIYYDKLNLDDRKQIWEQFFDKLSDEREDFVIAGRARAYVLEDETICQMEWNGREIRNAFQTAVALAEFRFLQKPNKTKHDYPILDQKDFEQVCKMMRQFKEYLVGVHGVDEDARAFMYKARRDSRNRSDMSRGQGRHVHH